MLSVKTTLDIPDSVYREFKVKTAQNGEKIGLTFTEIKSTTESSILMYRDGVADLMLHPSEVSEDYICSAKAIVISGTALSQSPDTTAP